MKSDFADLSLSGAFDVSSLSKVISANIDKISNDLRSKHITDSSETQNVSSYTSSCKNIYMEYSLDVKNLEPLYTFTGNDSIKFVGKINGNISDSCGIFVLTTKGKVKYFAFVLDK